MSDAPANPDRVWDAGLRDNDIVAVITCFDRDDGPQPADLAGDPPELADLSVYLLHRRC